MENKKELLVGSPAGLPADAEGQQPEGVLVLNARDERAIGWLIEQVGFEAVQEACGRLVGRRRLYPTNLAKVLGLTIPESVVTTPPAAALERIHALRKQFPALR